MNKTGYFDNKNREYIIENMYPRRPLKNFLWNEGFILDLDQFGFGLSKACINKVFRPLIYDCRIIYLRDNDTGEWYDINRNLLNKKFDMHRTHVGLGYHVVESEYNQIKADFTVLVPQKNFVEMHRVGLENKGNKKRNLSIITYINPNINVTEHQAYTKARYDEEMKGIYFAHRPYGDSREYIDVFYTASEQAVAYALARDDLLGTYGSIYNPTHITDRFLCKQTPVFEPYYAGVLQFDITLDVNQKSELYFAVGTARSREECLSLANEYSNKQSFEKELDLQKQTAENHIQTATVQTCDEYLDTMATIWLKRQMSLGKTWGRVYGKGFRDVLQDLTGFVSLDPALARERLLYTLKHQFVNGNAIRMFDPILDHPYQDMPAWIAPAVLAYLKESGDLSVLDEKVGYYKGEDIDSVFDHVKRGMDFLFREQGEHGLNLWGGGDWNDSMNGVGLNMKGESVWLSIATVNASADYIEIIQNSNISNKEELIADTVEKREALKKAIRTHGMENGRFIYGINDWGEKIGSVDSEEAKIFLNPQTWAVMGDILSQEEKVAVMQEVEKHLKCDYGYMLQDKPYLKGNERIGRVSYFEPGVYENGSVYNHGVMFKVVADCVAKLPDNAWETLKMNRYDNPKNADSGVEPYAISNMYFGPASPKKGYAPLSWITGSASWMYRAIIEFILGVKPEINGLRLAPCLPTSWKGAKISRIFRGVKYNIEYIPANEYAILVDGKKIEGNLLPLLNKDSEHNIICYYVK